MGDGLYDLSLINKYYFEYNKLFKKLGLDVIVEDNNECILENMKKILAEISLDLV